ncbi:MAG: alpha/beta hydrolase family protein [Planctomycetota bacterium]
MRPKLPATVVCVIAFLLCLSSTLDAQQKGRVEKKIKGYKKSVLAFVPGDYAKSKTWGLVLCMHGTGMSGPGIARSCSVAKINEAGYILACPTSLQGAWGTATSGGTKQDKENEAKYLRAILDAFTKDYSIHPDRIHFIGYSAGSTIAAHIVAYSSHFKGVKIRSINCHSGGYTSAGAAPAARAKETAVWVLNGSRDTGHDQPARTMCGMFQKAGYDARFQEVQGKGHSFPLVKWDEIVGWWKKLDEVARDWDKYQAKLKKAQGLAKKRKYGAAYKACEDLLGAVRGGRGRSRRRARRR